MVDGELPVGSFLKIARAFGCAKCTVRRVWVSLREREANFLATLGEVETKKRMLELEFYKNEMDKSGRPILHDRNAIAEATKSIPKKCRRTYRKLAARLSIPLSTLYKIQKKESIFRIHTSPLRPTLTEEQKVARFIYSMESIDWPVRETRVSIENMHFKDMMDVIHVDEKWFHLIKDGTRFILLRDEDDPYRHTKHKSFIGKVMFLCAMARPRVLDNGEFWNGKVGIWPVGGMERAVRSSVNRPAGTMVWKNHSMTRDKYRSMLRDHVFPAIMGRFPHFTEGNFVVRVQQDGAKAHILDPGKDEELQQDLEDLGLADRIKLYLQPAQSPDLNINDLGFFAAVQALYEDEVPSNSEEIIEFVNRAYWNYEDTKLCYLWLTLQTVLNKVIECNGHNDYKIPHLGKERLQREGRLPANISVSKEAIEAMERAGIFHIPG